MSKVRFSKKQIIIVIIVVLFVACGIFLNYLNNVKHYQQTVQAMTFSEIDLSSVPDGVYVGECDVDFIYAKVQVSIVSGVISNIDIVEHRNEKGATAEKIVTDIVEEQKIDVDAISGATNSSKVLKKAVENAITMQ
jgi:uncharacterized protein with FMN-binding domain